MSWTVKAMLAKDDSLCLYDMCFLLFLLYEVIKSIGSLYDNNLNYYLPRSHVLLLEDDQMQAAKRTVDGFLESVNQLIEKGEKSQANINLKNLIEQNQPSSFHGAFAHFDSFNLHVQKM